MRVSKEIEAWIRNNYQNVFSANCILEVEEGKKYLANVSFSDRTTSHFAGSQWVEIPIDLIMPH